MTSIVTVSPARNIYEQVKWKCQVYVSLFTTIIIVQSLFGFLAMNGAGSLGMNRGFVEYQESYFSLDSTYIISVIVLFILGWMLANSKMIHQNYSVVNSATTDTIANFILIALLSAFTMFASLCVVYIIMLIQIMTENFQQFYIEKTVDIGMLVVFYMMISLASSIGYLLKTIFDYSKILFIGMIVLLIVVVNLASGNFLPMIFGASMLAISIRTIIYVLVIWCIILLIQRRKEVNRL
ncbi:hypothetical protein [Solibacillus daqui]|uniref:hypothetical protein n=1 Tax=Solibacillus daqui TaxID=2912187 RepID=UPI002365E0BA|nr:hypothetical protein [Solibacillus daqui]